MSSKPRTSEELVASSNHLHYEIWMLQTLANAMELNFAGHGALNNAMLESFVIHARNLIYFFFADKPKGDHCVATDFFPEGNWEEICPDQSTYLKKASRRAHKEVAHLSYDRIKVTSETKPWEYMRLANEINVIVSVFFKNIPKRFLGEDWKSTIANQK